MERTTAIALYDRLVAAHSKVERKGDTMPYTSVNGHMFSVVTKEGVLALRLPEGDRDTFVRRFKTTNAVMYGCVMPEYVLVPDALLSKTAELKKYFDLSYEYVVSLKPKPTSRTKTTAKKKRPAGRK